MKCSEALEKIEYEIIQGSVDAEFVDVIYNTKKLCKDCMFICIKGANFDSHDVILDVVKGGAKIVVVSRQAKDLPMEELAKYDVTVIGVESTRYAMAFISAAYFGYPTNKLKVIGITGTKGKTTTTYLVKSILENAGFEVGLIGTIEIIIKDRHIPASGTTPESYELQSYFAQMVEAGIQVVVMEVSSQGLMQHRTQGFLFDYGIFTNISPDHISPTEHSSFEQYMECKSLLFRQCRVGIVNGDEAHLPAILKGHTCEVETFGLHESNDLCAKNLNLYRENDTLGVEFDTEGKIEMHAKVITPGKFSVYNALTAIAICRHFGVTVENITKALLLAKVKGRIEPVKVADDFTLLIDYAHNAMSLSSLLETLKDYNPERIICLFGCGGNRSRDRRFEMGEVSGNLADLTIITSDNPRKEEPAAIMADIETGIKKTNGKYVMILDRKEAIRYAIQEGKAGDIVVLAGKGHEDYQEINGVKYPMDERVIIKEILEETEKS